MDQDEATADSVPTIQFTNIDDLVREKYSQSGDILRVTNVSLMDFRKIDEEYGWAKIQISQYFESSQCMLVTIPTSAHVQLHLALHNLISRRLDHMGLDDSWNPTGAMTCYSQGFRSGNSNGNGSAGSADSSMSPLRERNRGFPTLMIDAGCSHSLSSMRSKAKWCFQISNHHIKIVLLAKLDESQQVILLERWEERQQEQVGGGEAEWVASCQQAMTISDTGTEPPVYRVTGGDLVLDLKLLLLKSPPQGEEYIVLTADDLQEYAIRVSEWAVQERYVPR